jgi:hypothetical protein
MGAEAFAEYRSAIHAPATVHAMLEDYRAGGPGTHLLEVGRAGGSSSMSSASRCAVGAALPSFRPGARPDALVWVTDSTQGSG